MSTDNLLDEIKATLASFPQVELVEAGRCLLKTLGYCSDRKLELSGGVDDFIGGVSNRNDDTKHEDTQSRVRFRQETASVNILFQVTDSEISDALPALLDGGDFDTGNKSSFMFIAVELRGQTYPRGAYAELTREVNKLLSQPTVVLFRTADDLLTIAFVHRRPHKRDRPRDVLGRVSLIREIDTSKPHRAHLDILAKLALSERLKWMNTHHMESNFDGLLAAWLDALDTEELNRNFYKQLFAWFERAVQEAEFPTKQAKTLRAEEHVIRLITRLLFVWFIKEKGLIAPELFIEAQVKSLLRDYDRENGDSYYRAVLQNLFFATLNSEIIGRRFSTKSREDHREPSYYRFKEEIADPDRLLGLFGQTPFINGGLFDCLDSFKAPRDGGYRIDCFSDNVIRLGSDDFKILSIPNCLFFDEKGLITLFENFKFTVEENTPTEQEVALDPELLGKVFENLLAAYNPETRETARKQTGSYYTPRAVVDYMVDEALVAFLAQNCSPADGDTEFWKERLSYLMDYEDAFDDAHELFEDVEKESLVRAIAQIKLIDPAVGSGAFPMGALHKLTLALRRLDPENRRWESLQKEQAGQRATAAFDTEDKTERETELKEISDTFDKYRGSDFGRKLYLIQNSIYGVDIQPVACQIARLRFFISLAIEQDPSGEAEDNYGIKPLPNLETRFVAANTLLALGSSGTQMNLTPPEVIKLQELLNTNREHHFHATTRHRKLACKKKDKALRGALSEELKRTGMPADDAEKIAFLDLYDQNAQADWFDAGYMFGVAEGFDVVIGNPPYISHDKISREVKPQLRRSYQSYQPFADASCYFIEKAVGLQNNRGVLSFITSNSYLRADYGAPIRKLLSNETAVHRVLNIEESQIFENAIVNVAIMVACKSTSYADSCVVVNAPFSGNHFDEYVESKGFNYPQSHFDSKPWNLLEPKLVQLQRKLERTGKTLEQLKAKIRLGIATGSNEAFLIDEDRKRELCNKNPINAVIIRPVLRGRDISRYSYSLSGDHILLTRNGVNVERDYREIYEHFISFGSKFRNRGAQGQHWTNLRACSFYDDFKREKIVWIELTDIGRFALCIEEVYLLNSAYFMLPPTGMDSRFLLGILNSSTIRFYLGLIAVTSGMGVSRWINNYVKKFPIPTAAYEKQASLVDLVNRILAAKHINPSADTRALEEEIDRLVYDLYGLTDEEIAVVEGLCQDEH